MTRLLAAVFLVGWLTGPALAVGLDAEAINNAEFQAPSRSDHWIDPAIVKIQVLLDRALFSPGEIDAKFAENTQKALRTFAATNGLSFDNKLTQDLWRKLTDTSREEAK